MVVEVQGEETSPNECAGWLYVRSGQKNDSKEERTAKPNIARRAAMAATRAARMPGILPKMEDKIIVRPRGGLNMARVPATVVAAAIREAAGISEEEASGDTHCPNVHQNIMVVSTPDRERARRYMGVTSLRIGDKTYEASAYGAAPHDTVKGVVRGIPLEDSADVIRRKVVNSRNPLACGTQRIGSSTTIIVMFEGQRVPNYVRYGEVLLRCTLYRKHFDVCKNCGKVGHRRDVCPNPNVKVCFGCGLSNPGEGHDSECKPRCKLCGGPHPTGEKDCKNKFKVPYVVKRRQWERKEQAAAQQMAPENFPPLPARSRRESLSQKRGRSRSISRGRSASRGREPKEKVSWAGAVKQQQPKKQDDKELQALRQVNQQLKAKNMELEAKMKKMEEDMIEFRRALQQMRTQPMEETEDEGEPDPKTVTTEEPAPKKRALENIKRRRESERMDKMEERLGRVEAYLGKVTEQLSEIRQAIVMGAPGIGQQRQPQLQQQWLGQPQQPRQ